MVLKVEDLWEQGLLTSATELFLFMYNFTCESVFYKGNMKSPEMYDLVLHLHKIQMEANLFIHFIWVSGWRMILQGGDGLSRGDLTNGVM